MQTDLNQFGSNNNYSFPQKKSRRKSLTQFIPKNNAQFNPYNNNNDNNNNNINNFGIPSIPSMSFAVSSPTAPSTAMRNNNTSSFPSSISSNSPHIHTNHANPLTTGTASSSQSPPPRLFPTTKMKRSKTVNNLSSKSATTTKPDFRLKRRYKHIKSHKKQINNVKFKKNTIDNSNSNSKNKLKASPIIKSVSGGYYTDGNTTENDTEIETDIDGNTTDNDISFDVNFNKNNKKKKLLINGQVNTGYLSDGSALINHSNKNKASYYHSKRKSKHKKKSNRSFLQNNLSSKLPQKSTKILHNSISHNVISLSNHSKIRTSSINDNNDKINYNYQKRFKKKVKKTSRDKLKDKAKRKRHSVGHCDSSTLGILKGRYDSSTKSTINTHGISSGVKWNTQNILRGSGSSRKNSYKYNDNDNANKSKSKRRSLFNDQTTSLLTHNSSTFNELNSNKWDVDELRNSSESEFRDTLGKRSKDDIIELCWDLLKSKDKSDELLRMVSVMNNDLEPDSAYTTMMSTIVRTLEVKYASLYTLETDSTYLKCLWTSSGEPDRDIMISITNKTQLPARVWRSNHAIKLSITENNDSICPDFAGFGNVYVMGIPIYDGDDKLGVLIAYRDRLNIYSQFNDRDLYSASLLTSIAANTLKNVSIYSAIASKEKQTREILSIIDEMSGDVSNGYKLIIEKLVVKIRSLVRCVHIDFWSINIKSNSLICELSDNIVLKNTQIDINNSHILGQCVLTGKHIKIDNTRLDTRYSDSQLKYSSSAESILIIPVFNHNMDPIAIIQAINKIPSMKLNKNNPFLTNNNQLQAAIPFTHSDRRILETFATSASIIIKNSLSFQKINGLNKKHGAMVGILRSLQEKYNPTQMLSGATLAIRSALEAEKVCVYFENGSGQLDSLDFNDYDDDDIDYKDDDDDDTADAQVISSIFTAISRYCAEDKMLINTPNLFEDEELWNSINDYIDYDDIKKINENNKFLKKTCSILCVPICSNDTVVGVIQAIYKKGTSASYINNIGFTLDDQQIVEAVSAEIAHTITRNISDLCLQKYVDRHDDIPLDVIEYYLTGSLDQQQRGSRPPNNKLSKPTSITYVNTYSDDDDDDDDSDDTYNTFDDNISNATGGTFIIRKHVTGDLDASSSMKSVYNTYSPFKLDIKLSSYCSIYPTCDFDVTKFNLREDLEQFVLYSIDSIGLIKEFQLNISKLKNFISAIAKLYRINPFHNWQHGFFVFHFVYYFICEQDGITDILSSQHLLSILIASMCHDVDHPGNDNLYEIEADTDLARIYNGLSVLENHHSYTTLALLRKNEYNFFDGSNLDLKSIKNIKKIICKSIMTTDMTHHSETISWINDFNKDDIIKCDKLAAMKDVARSNILMKICQCIVHCGDLSAQTYPWRIAKEWERRIAKEFKQQTIKENKKNIPVREWMAKTDLNTRYKNQHFFVQHVVKPLWDAVVILFPNMIKRLSTLKLNSQKYIEIANKKAKS